MAFGFSSGKIPASRDQNDQKDSDADKIGNQYRMQIDYGRKQCIHTKDYTILARKLKIFVYGRYFPDAR
jgi:hypothetical protein